jgi:ribonuclease HI
MDQVTIYTDGACEGNPGPGGYAAIIDENGTRREIQGSAAQTTNNRMELSAIIAGLAALEKPSNVTVVTDSQYVVNGMKSWIHNWRRKGWRNASGAPVKNRDLWEALDEHSRRHRVKWEWIRGHAGHPENERADLLAREAVHAGEV